VDVTHDGDLVQANSTINECARASTNISIHRVHQDQSDIALHRISNPAPPAMHSHN
jgi:hypothetical protein